ncbi:MAG: hypothetical protein WD250_08205 [Egibacteraceae bacterium]
MNRVAKVVLVVVVVAAVVLLLFTVVFPWVDTLLDDPTLGVTAVVGSPAGW